jgi:hypothetical protein
LLLLELAGRLSIGREHLAGDTLEFSLRMGSDESEENSEWTPCADFLFRREPSLALKINGETYEEDHRSRFEKMKEGEKNRRKALRVIECFVPRDLSKQTVYRKYKSAVQLAAQMNVKPKSLTAQLSIARSFLEKIGSKYTISKSHPDEPLQLITR